MRVVIIEDENLVAEDLANILTQLSGEIQVAAILPSISEAVQYFNRNSHPDLIFCDIQLGDGHSFEIFRSTKIEVPVIFCTAYDEYALEAFRNNGIDYVLKPFSQKIIKAAVEKYKTLRASLAYDVADYKTVFKNIFPANTKKESSVLVNWKDKIIPVKIDDIALFTIDHKSTQLITFGNQKYFISQTLDELENVCGTGFYRANRQFLVNREAVAEALQYHSRKLVLLLKAENKSEIIISKNKVTGFLNWLRSL